VPETISPGHIAFFRSSKRSVQSLSHIWFGLSGAPEPSRRPWRLMMNRPTSAITTSLSLAQKTSLAVQRDEHI
jgi:hypothetical protein